MTTAAALPFDYEEEDVPSVARGGVAKMPNPHKDIVLYLHANVATEQTEDGKPFRHARSVAVPVVTGEDGKVDEKETQTLVNRHIRQLREVGDEHETPFTVRTDKAVDGVRTVGKGAKATEVPVKVIRFWVHTNTVDGVTVPARITRTVKPADAAASSVGEGSSTES